MNLSTLLSISLVDENSEELEVKTIDQNCIEFFIPRDVNLEISSMFLQNVSSNSTNQIMNNNDQFNLHWINITQMNSNVSFSIHFEMHPLNESLSYMLIYKFDQIPQLNSSFEQIDGWTIFCPQSTKE